MKVRSKSCNKHLCRRKQSLEPIRDAVAGLDAALAQLAEASKLALEEAAGRAQKFSNEELTRARDRTGKC